MCLKGCPFGIMNIREVRLKRTSFCTHIPYFLSKKSYGRKQNNGQQHFESDSASTTILCESLRSECVVGRRRLYCVNPEEDYASMLAGWLVGHHLSQPSLPPGGHSHLTPPLLPHFS